MTTRSSASASRSFSSVARRVLIGGQIALSVVLLMVGGLFLKSFSRAHYIDLGFNPNHLLLVTIDPLLQGYSNDQSSRFHEQLLQRVAALPGVTSATVATKAPFLSGDSWDMSIDGYTAPDGEKFMDIVNNEVDPKYFSTMQIPILYGREFVAHRHKKISGRRRRQRNLRQKLHHRLRRYQQSSRPHHSASRRRAASRSSASAKDSSYGDQLGTPPPPVFYLPYLQQGGPRATLHVRSDADPAVILPAVRAEITALDARFPRSPSTK